MIGHNEVVVFDRYLDQSLKNKTGKKRQITSTEYDIHPECVTQGVAVFIKNQTW